MSENANISYNKLRQTIGLVWYLITVTLVLQKIIKIRVYTY